MSHKQIAIIAVVTLVVFGGAIIMYPLIFNPTATPAGQVDVALPPPVPVTQ